MEKKRYRKGDVLVEEGKPQDKMFIVTSGETVREKLIEGQVYTTTIDSLFLSFIKLILV